MIFQASTIINHKQLYLKALKCMLRLWKC